MTEEILETDQNSNGRYKEDSQTLMRVYGSMNGSYRGGIGAISNPVTGLNTGRDPTNYLQVNSFTYILTDDERETLYRVSRICKNIVNTYPMEGKWANFTFGTKRFYYGADSQTVTDYFDNGLKNGSLHKKFIEASIEARLHGLSYLLIGVDDGRSFDQPIDLENIESFDWAEVRTKRQAQRVEDEKDVYLVSLDFENLSAELKDNRSLIKVHKSRLIEFIGDYLPHSVLKRAKEHDSALQAAYDGFALAMSSLMYSNAMMADHSLFWYKLDGLSQLIKQKKEDEIYSRFLSLQMGKSVLKGLAMDAKSEDAGFISRNYSGVKDIVDQMISYMVAETGMVRYKVLGVANNTGLGAEGRGLQDRLEHSFKLQSWQDFTWKDNLMYCLKLYLLSRKGMTGGRLPKSYGFFFPPSLELTPVEIAELQEKNVNWINAAITSGLIHKYEGRQALFQGTEPNIIVTVNLDERMSAFLEDQLENETDSEKSIEQSTVFESPENLKVIDPENESDSVYSEIQTNQDSIGTHNDDIARPDQTPPMRVTLSSGRQRPRLRHNSISEDRKKDLLDRWEVQTRERDKPYVVYASSRNEAIRKAKQSFTGGKKTIISVRPLRDKGIYYRDSEVLAANTQSGIENKTDDDSNQNPIERFPGLKESTVNKLKKLSSLTDEDFRETLKIVKAGKSPSEVATFLKSLIEKKEITMKNLVKLLFDKEILIDDFILQIANDLKDIHIAQSVIARNGVIEKDKALPNWQVEAVSKSLREQFFEGRDPQTKERFGLSFLAEDLTKENSREMIEQRIDLYHKSGKVSFHRTTKDSKQQMGMTEGLRILGKSEHCPDCIEYAARGWVSLSDLILPTQSCQCKNRCNCRILYR